MIVEDTAEIDQYTDIHNAAAWRVFWGRSRFLLPLWILAVLFWVEQLALIAWRFGRPWSDAILPTLVIIGIPSLPFALIASSTFRRRVSRQQVELDAAGIKTLGPNQITVPWERVGGLTLNEMPGAPGICIFSMGYARLPGTTFWTRPLPGTGQTPPRKRQARELMWLRLALSHLEQTQTLRTGIDVLRANNPLIPEL
ncbi:MAG TPA: hypothetical protein VL527_15690, partial [Dongiaceae bacterium]|nr:hypothetical protein [Dongiaceae bacterium]